MDALMTPIEEIEFVNLDFTSKAELFAYIVLPLCIALFYWGMGEDDEDEENSKKAKRRK